MTSSIPCLSRCHRECTTAECLPLKARHDKIGRRSRPKIPSRHNLRHTREFVGEVARRQSMEAPLDQHRQLVVDPIGISKLVQRCHARINNLPRIEHTIFENIQTEQIQKLEQPSSAIDFYIPIDKLYNRSHYVRPYFRYFSLFKITQSW